MQLNNVGEICILDLNEIVNRAYMEIKKYDKTATLNENRIIASVLGDIFNDYLTCRMHWTKHYVLFDTKRYVDKLGSLLKNHPAPDLFIQYMEGDIEDLLAGVVKLPTWRIISCHIRGVNVKLEMGDDFRLIQWDKEHGHEYRGSGRDKTW